MSKTIKEEGEGGGEGGVPVNNIGDGNVKTYDPLWGTRNDKKKKRFNKVTQAVLKRLVLKRFKG